ncbi:MAG: hypothetical protein EPN93_13890 [Spirochaetes bacterium]|nr:MAG: hypothetical protein EPN93_13890 [Spirochaetota bacterium]
MKKGFINILYHTRNYFGAEVATRALAFISIPVMTRLLTPEEYGIVNVFNSYISIFVIIFTFNTFAAVSRYYYENSNDFTSFFSTSIMLSAITILVSSAAFHLLNYLIPDLLKMPPELSYYIVPFVIFTVATSFYDQVYAPQKQSKKIAARMTVQAYSSFALSIGIILFLDEKKYLGQIYAYLIVGILFLFYYIWQLKPYFNGQLKSDHIHYIVSNAVVLIPYALSNRILNYIDRIMINTNLGASDAGLYSFAYNIGMLLNVFFMAVFRAWIPYYFELMDGKDYKKLFDNTKRIFKLIIIAALFLIYFGKEIGMLLAKQNYYSGLGMIPIIVVGYLFNSLFFIYSWGFGYIKKPIYISLIVLVAAILNIAINAVFIPVYGAITAAYATVAAYMVMAVSAWFFTRRIPDIYSPPAGFFLKCMGALLPFILPLYFLDKLSLSLSILIKFALFTFFAIIVFWSDRKEIFKFIQKIAGLVTWR